MRTITMTIKGKKISFAAEVPEGIQSDIDLMGNMESEEQAIEMFGTDIPNLKNLLNAVPKIVQTRGRSHEKDNWEGKKIDTTKTTTSKETVMTTTKTKAVHVTIPGLDGFYLSREFLLGTGSKMDEKLVKTDRDTGEIIVYDIAIFDLTAKCSQKVRDAVEGVFEDRVAKAKRTIAELPKSTMTEEASFTPAKDGKKEAEKQMVEILKNNITGNWGEHVGIETKGQWLANFTDCGFRKSTVEKIHMTTKSRKDGVAILYIHIESEAYKSDRERWGKVLNSIRVACRKSRLMFSSTESGKLPISIRGMGKNETY